MNRRECTVSRRLELSVRPVVDISENYSEELNGYSHLVWWLTSCLELSSCEVKTSANVRVGEVEIWCALDLARQDLSHHVTIRWCPGRTPPHVCSD